MRSAISFEAPLFLSKSLEATLSSFAKRTQWSNAPPLWCRLWDMIRLCVSWLEMNESIMKGGSSLSVVLSESVFVQSVFVDRPETLGGGDASRFELEERKLLRYAHGADGLKSFRAASIWWTPGRQPLGWVDSMSSPPASIH